MVVETSDHAPKWAPRGSVSVPQGVFNFGIVNFGDDSSLITDEDQILLKEIRISIVSPAENINDAFHIIF